MRFDEVRRIARMCQRKQVALIWDKMIIQPNLSFDANSELYGYASNKAGVLANSVVCFLFSALGQTLHHCLSFYPVNNLDSEFLMEAILENTQLLESVGLDVKVFICDNISTNRHVCRTMSGKEVAVLEQDPAMQHPTNPDKQVTFMCDPVHNFKCICNNFFRELEWCDDDRTGSISWNIL